MRVFPQLSTGASAQFPIMKQRSIRTAVNVHDDGSALKLLDPESAVVRWQLRYACLNDEELAAIEALFKETEGRLYDFTYLDPTDNLFAWSEDLQQTVWTKDPLLQFVGGVQDPFGSNRATSITNTGLDNQSISQRVDAPSWFQYCFSVFAKGQGTNQITLTRSTTSGANNEVFQLEPVWKQLTHSAQVQGSEESLTFGIEIESGETVELFGLQLEAQPAASEYKRTLAKSGVYLSSRFDTDALNILTQGSNQHSCDVSILALTGD